MLSYAMQKKNISQKNYSKCTIVFQCCIIVAFSFLLCGNYCHMDWGLRVSTSTSQTFDTKHCEYKHNSEKTPTLDA